ncbi:thiamine phosphate synthase [Mannheimia granulomatis]|uniref:thiamine phosphate synthase n=1 Tax=Mannheimia granulomatis TaxID=85402 RepID=UPI000479431D|nr:thiamine phosphate synthase [Mannheimia granulomatis]QLB18364.1 thiamine-phosphate diphosphorylase [Mannheimia granulomatis]
MSISHSHHSPKVIWTVAGSDSCAGAGLQTDLHTFHDFNVVGCSVVTSVTAQHPHGVLCVTPVDDYTFRQQFEALLIQGYPNAIKIGLLCSQNQVEILCEYIQKIRSESQEYCHVVYDPVAVASSGQALSDSIVLPVVQEKLYPLVDLITPNGTELALLSETEIATFEDVKTAAEKLFAQGIKAVLAKGGHFEWQGEMVDDYLLTPQESYCFSHPRLESVNTHGTGCTFASAIGAMLAKGFDLPDAVTVATAYLQKGLSETEGRGQTALSSLCHTGYPTDIAFFPQTELVSAPLDVSQKAFAPTDYQLGLYPVVESFEWIERLISAGVKTLQIRMKNRPLAEIENEIAQSVALAKQHNVRLFINDYWQLAVKYQAYGVHLGQEDLATADLHAIQQAGLRLGVSTHGYFEIMRALAVKPSYIAFGHVFPTQTKDMPSQPQGLINLANYADLVSPLHIPTIAIGGINQTNIEAVMQCGVGSAAVVSAITQAQDWQQAVKILEKFANGGKKGGNDE